MTLRPDVLGLVTSDMATTLAFYRRLGLPIPSGADDEQHVEVELSDGMRLAIDTTAVMQSFDPEFAARDAPGRSSLAFRADSPAEVDATYANLTGTGFHGHLPPWDAFWGQRYAVVHDPDGLTVDLYAQLGQEVAPEQDPAAE